MKHQDTLHPSSPINQIHSISLNEKSGVCEISDKYITYVYTEKMKVIAQALNQKANKCSEGAKEAICLLFKLNKFMLDLQLVVAA